MRLPWDREQKYPNLLADGYDVKSCEAWYYNCIGFAVGDQQRNWWPDEAGDYYWPIDRYDETLECFAEAFKTRQYELCGDSSLEAGFEKVAFYVWAGRPSHAAKQLHTGKWVSKLGEHQDIEHNSLAGLEGDYPAYGKAVMFMKRPILL